jgi:nicotinamide riboside kinase
MDLSIHKVKTEKDAIVQPRLAEMGIIPKINSSILLVGVSGSGKSTLCHNLVSDPRFYNGTKTFDLMFLISPTGLADDVQKQLGIPDDQVFTDLHKEGVPALEKIQASQEEQIQKVGAKHAPKVLVIFDDVIGDQKFMREQAFVKSFIACRHFNMTSILCTQHYRRVPRVCRLQANWLAFFALSNTEVETLHEEHAPPNMSKKGFFRLCTETLAEPYSFLVVDMKAPWEKRFHKGLSEVINLDYYRE